MAEVAKKWSKDLYPDLEKAGGLPQALQPLLARFPGDLKVEGLDEPFLVYASVKSGSRSSQVMIAAEHRAFNADFWAQGVQYGSGWAKSLDDVADAIHAFQGDGLGAAALRAGYPWVRVYDQAFIHERGAAAFVEDAWQRIVDWLAKEPPESHQGRLLPLLRACMERPRLRRLLPFTSHDRLCFSRTTGYPYTTECPPAFPLGDGLFRMDKASVEGPPVDGDAESIARALDGVLAPNCPAAAHGTADDLGAASAG
jgi:hypothetical protein